MILSENSKKLLEGMKVADGQIKLQTDNLKVLEVGRQSMGLQLKELLKNETGHYKNLYDKQFTL